MSSSYFSRLNPTERRFVVGVGLLFFLVIQIFLVWPHFSDWKATRDRMETARFELKKRDTTIREGQKIGQSMTNIHDDVNVPPEDQAFQFVRVINLQAAQSGVNFLGTPRQTTKTNDPFFLEQLQTVNVSGDEKQLVDFLYQLGAGNSLIRVRDMTVQPDQARQKLNAHVTFVASYQKKAPTRVPAKPATTPPATKPTPPAANPAANPAGATPPANRPPANRPSGVPPPPVRPAPSPTK